VDNFLKSSYKTYSKCVTITLTEGPSYNLNMRGDTMKKTSTVKASLIGNTSALGLNWIYDQDFLKEYTKNNDALFHPVNKDIYDKAKNAFYVYKNHNVGDLGYMGAVLYLLYKNLQNNSSLTQEQWINALIDYIKPGGEYIGYVETSGNHLIANYLNSQISKTDITFISGFEDKQLIGLLPFLAVYDLEIENKVEYSTLLAKTMTSFDQINDYNRLLFSLFESIKNGKNKQVALTESINFAPDTIKGSLTKALEMIDTYSFIESHSGFACYIEMTLPLIFHIVAHCETVEEALRLNAKLSGASSARGLFIGAIYNLLTGINEEYLDILNVKI
jgi:hypothetical protein